MEQKALIFLFLECIYVAVAFFHNVIDLRAVFLEHLMILNVLEWLQCRGLGNTLQLLSVYFFLACYLHRKLQLLFLLHFLRMLLRGTG